MDNKALSPRVKRAGREAEYPPYQLVPSLRKCGATTSLPHRLS